jgi:hypothetical protein
MMASFTYDAARPTRIRRRCHYAAAIADYAITPDAFHIAAHAAEISL